MVSFGLVVQVYVGRVLGEERKCNHVIDGLLRSIQIVRPYHRQYDNSRVF